jgi:gamma-glutamyltranspeptidase/glutathione hydrolase
MVVTAHPLASKAGLQILRDGGSALDAAIAAQMVLTLVEPQSSGIGGGAFLLHYRQIDRLLQAFDGRETAPEAAGPDLFLKPDGSRMKWTEARQGGRSVGVPGTVRMLALAHREHGKLPWAALFAPAITLAAEGFPVPERMHAAVVRVKDWSLLPEAAAYFLDPQGEPWPAGHLLKNQALAATFRALAADPHALNEGTIAAQIVAAVRGYEANPGLLTVEDLAAYQPKVREAVCGLYLAYRICGMPPPSSGGPTVLMILGLSERLNLHEHDPLSPAWAHLFAEASRVAFADRNQYMADPDFVPQPTAGLIDPGYLDQRARLIDRAKALTTVEPGRPPEKQGSLLAPHPGLNERGTSHLSIVDETGNVVSMTTTIESSLGSRLMVGGFLLNNELTDFSFLPEKDGKPIANRVQSGKRPRSSMAPVIAFDAAGEPVLVAGSPGGSRIIGYTAGAIVRILGHGMHPEQAAAARHVINRNGATTEVEEGEGAEVLAAALTALGHKVKVRGLTSGLHLIKITEQGLQTGVDPRREGMAAGE